MNRKINLNFVWLKLLLGIAVMSVATRVHADNKVMGSIEFQGKSKVEKTSGVWVDGQYVGYLKELHGSKKVLLLSVVMEKAITPPMPKETATVKIEVKPDRAAVFVDGQFAGHAGEFGGAGRAMLIAPGEHHIRIALPGYNSFETDINPLANQKVSVKTELAKSSDPLPDPVLKSDPDSSNNVPQTPPASQ